MTWRNLRRATYEPVVSYEIVSETPLADDGW
jgi:hypothetical protein